MSDGLLVRHRNSSFFLNSILVACVDNLVDSLANLLSLCVGKLIRRPRQHISTVLLTPGLPGGAKHVSNMNKIWNFFNIILLTNNVN